MSTIATSLVATRRPPTVTAAAVLLALLLTAGAEARPMLDPCTYERPVCPTYAPR